MSAAAPFVRPDLEEALEAWKKILRERGFSTDLLWLFEENLCLERAKNGQGGFRFGFQTRFTPPAEDAVDIAFQYFCESEARVVFYRLGSCRRKSVCVLLCDSWFDRKSETDGYTRRDDWGMSFHPGPDDETEEITDLTRWLRRIKRVRAFHELDFCMTLEAVEEVRVYGRPLAPYERFAEAMFKRLRQFLGQPA